jgi:hypothetical protein
LPKQNRVNPFGDLIATQHRGTLLGNRGCLHDKQRRIRRSFAGKRWIFCVLQFRGRHRTIMAPGRYTELFFLDEATALAAGHRPCAECQRERYRLFRAVWAAANPDRAAIATSSIDEMDAVLHAERLAKGGAKQTYPEQLSRLPHGAMVVLGDRMPYLVLASVVVPWTPGGYGPPISHPPQAEVQVLTPRSIVHTIAHGFPVEIHVSALAG